MVQSYTFRLLWSCSFHWLCFMSLFSLQPSWYWLPSCLAYFLKIVCIPLESSQAGQGNPVRFSGENFFTWGMQAQFLLWSPYNLCPYFPQGILCLFCLQDRSNPITRILGKWKFKAKRSLKNLIFNCPKSNPYFWTASTVLTDSWPETLDEMVLRRMSGPEGTTTMLCRLAVDLVLCQ